MCLGKLSIPVLLTLPRAPGSTKAIKSEEAIGMLKAQRSMVVSAVTLTEDLE